MSRLDAATEWEKEARAARYAVTPLAKALGVSRQHLRRYFIERWGFAPKGCLERLRIDDAIVRLRQRKPIKVVAAELGFDCESHFARAFRQHCGCSPHEFCCGQVLHAMRPPAAGSKLAGNVPFWSMDCLASGCGGE
jgi:AraC-like DNA-binding protein